MHEEVSLVKFRLGLWFLNGAMVFENSDLIFSYLRKSYIEIVELYHTST